MLDPQALLDLLKAKHIPYTLYSHPPVGSGDCDDLFPAMKGEILKNLVLRTKKGKLVLFTLPLKAHADLKAIASALELPRFSFARVSDLCFMGVPPGMVTPLALLNDVGHEICYAEPVELSQYPLINCHPLRNDHSIDIALKDVHALIAESGHEIIKLTGALLNG